ncbi:hypothetical protein [Methanoregula sp.]|uniref:hypothetical protein n=1 Tax=Methanoregula sp. TaxID=2052170 RepID=UPI002D1ADF2F|nr:hypothetical protein [Methanoregula sp.]HVP97420.1 hypothetical protein [Methanoregula sp.]
MREAGGGSPEEREFPGRHVPGAGTSGWSIEKDLTQDSLELIIEDTEDLFA